MSNEILVEYRVNVHEEAQLLRIALPVSIHRRILILFRIVEAIKQESHVAGEVRGFCRIALPGIELRLGLIENWERPELANRNIVLEAFAAFLDALPGIAPAVLNLANYTEGINALHPTRYLEPELATLLWHMDLPKDLDFDSNKYISVARGL